MLPDVATGGEDIRMAHDASLFKVGVGQGAVWVGGADKSGGNGVGERCPPKERWSGARGIKPDTAHARCTSIDGTDVGGVGVDDFTPSGRPDGKVVGQEREVCQLVVDSRSKVESVGGARRGRVCKDGLELGEETPTAGEGKGHAAQFPEQTLPFAPGSTPLVRRKRGQEEAEAVDTVGW